MVALSGEVYGRGFKTESVRQKAGALVRDHWKVPGKPGKTKQNKTREEVIFKDGRLNCRARAKCLKMVTGVKCTAVIPAPLRQEDSCSFKACLDYIESSRPARAGKTLPNKQTKSPMKQRRRKDKE